jgi:hypothetical protein
VGHGALEEAVPAGGANSSGTTFFLAIRWKTTFFDKIAQMRYMERPK